MEDGQEQGGTFARGVASPFGKCTREIKVHLDEQTFFKVLEFIHNRGTGGNASDLGREAFFLIVYGKTPEQLEAEMKSNRSIEGALSHLRAGS